VIGTDRPVPDAAMKASGTLLYGDDLDIPGLVHAKLLLSPVAHARVTAVDASRAEALPGVIGVFSHFTAPSDLYSRYRILPGQQQCPMDEALFAETARFVGDRIAAVVAEDPLTAEEATRLIRVEYAELPFVLTPEEALADDATPVHPGGNLVHEFLHEAGAPQTDADDVTVTTTVRTPRVHHAALETHVCLAHQDESGILTIWSPTQSVFGVRTVVADLFGMSYSHVHVIKIPMGGSFGGKQEFILEPVTAFLARATGRPVKLVLNREECIAATMVRPATTSRIDVRVRRDGLLAGIDVDTLLDAGAYATSSPDYVEMMSHKIGRLYRTPHLRHHGRVAYTNTPVTGGARGWAAPEIITAMEIAMDRVAGVLGIDPVDLRLKNLVHPYDADPVERLSLGDARVRECLELGAEAFDWSTRRSAPRGEGRYRRGVGVACGAHKNGILSPTFSDFFTVIAKMNEDGSVALTTSLHEVGGGAIALMQLIVAEELGISPDDVSVTEADSAATPYDYGCYGSRGAYVCGAGAQKTAVALRRRIVDAAARLSGVAAEQLEAGDGGVRARDGRLSLTYGEVVMRTKLELGEDIFAQDTHTATSNPGSYCVQFAEVEVDSATGLTRVTDFLVVSDIGRALNPLLARGQFQGGVQMGIGFALSEEVRLDDRGRPAAGGFKNYHVVNAPDMPEVKVLFVEHEGDDGPYGAKSVGEIATVPTAAAVVNAVSHALGVTFTDLPVTPEKVIAALAAGEGEA
jgi:xanthine dehydrogenase molybdenum-binding subunit